MEMGDQQNLPPLSDGRLGRFFLGERRDVAGAEDEYEMKLSCRLFGDVLDGIAQCGREPVQSMEELSARSRSPSPFELSIELSIAAGGIKSFC